MPYSKYSTTIGERILIRRCELTKGYSKPEIQFDPAIIVFPGYEFTPEPKTLEKKVVTEHLGIDDDA